MVIQDQGTNRNCYYLGDVAMKIKLNQAVKKKQSGICALH